MSVDCTTATVATEGAELYYEIYGESGPPLLMITPGGGDLGFYTLVFDRLAQDYRVISFDRRGNSRSSGREGTLDVAQQARDALAVLDAAGASTASVFGNSGGAIIGMELVARFPERVDVLVAHEPPTMQVLPDAQERLDFYDRLDALYREQGYAAASELFLTQMTLAEEPPAEAAFPALARIDENMRSWFYGGEVQQFARSVPDVEAIRASGVPVALAAGKLSGDAAYARTARVLAERIGCEYVEFPGHHMSFLDVPQEFSDMLLPTLARLHAERGAP